MRDCDGQLACDPVHTRPVPCKVEKLSIPFGNLDKIHHIMSSTGLISHSSWMISEDVALTSGSQVNIFRINFRSISFSSPGGTVVIKFSKEVSGIGGSAIHLPVVIRYQYLAQNTKIHWYEILKLACFVKICPEKRASFDHIQRWRAKISDILGQC